MQLDKLESNFLKYIIAEQVQANESLPTLQEISGEMKISVNKLREELSVARALGIVSSRPRRGTRRESYDFAPAVLISLLFGLGTGDAEFVQFSQLRRVVETSFWDQAVAQLTEEDKTDLKAIVAAAWQKLKGAQVHIPNKEHRQLHLKIFSRLNNPFVQGILVAYWEAYAASEYTRLTSYEYWTAVWNYHERIVAALCDNDSQRGLQLLREHFELLPEHPEANMGD